MFNRNLDRKASIPKDYKKWMNSFERNRIPDFLGGDFNKLLYESQRRMNEIPFMEAEDFLVDQKNDLISQGVGIGVKNFMVSGDDQIFVNHETGEILPFSNMTSMYTDKVTAPLIKKFVDETGLPSIEKEYNQLTTKFDDYVKSELTTEKKIMEKLINEYNFASDRENLISDYDELENLKDNISTSNKYISILEKNTDESLPEIIDIFDTKKKIGDINSIESELYEDFVKLSNFPEINEIRKRSKGENWDDLQYVFSKIKPGRIDIFKSDLFDIHKVSEIRKSNPNKQLEDIRIKARRDYPVDKAKIIDMRKDKILHDNVIDYITIPQKLLDIEKVEIPKTDIGEEVLTPKKILAIEPAEITEIVMGEESLISKKSKKLDLIDVFTLPSEIPVESSVEKPIEKPKKKPIEKPEEKPIEKPEEKPIENPEEKPIEKPEEKLIEKPEEKPIEKPEEKPIEKPIENPEEKPIEISVEEEQIIFDKRIPTESVNDMISRYIKYDIKLTRELVDGIITRDEYNKQVYLLKQQKKREMSRRKVIDKKNRIIALNEAVKKQIDLREELEESVEDPEEKQVEKAIETPVGKPVVKSGSKTQKKINSGSKKEKIIFDNRIPNESVKQMKERYLNDIVRLGSKYQNNTITLDEYNKQVNLIKGQEKRETARRKEIRSKKKSTSKTAGKK